LSVARMKSIWAERFMRGPYLAREEVSRVFAGDGP
jgi:hypothetical protein